MDNLDLSRDKSRLDKFLDSMPGIEEQTRAQVYRVIAASQWSPADPYAHWIAIGIIMRQSGLDVAGELNRFPELVQASVQQALKTILGPVVKTAKMEVERAIAERKGELDQSAADMRSSITGEVAASLQNLERKAGDLLHNTSRQAEKRANAVLGGKAIAAAVVVSALLVVGGAFVWNSAYQAGRSATAGYAQEVAQWATRSDWPTISNMTRFVNMESAINSWCGAGSAYRRVVGDKDYCGPFPLNGVAVAGEGVTDPAGLWRVANGSLSGFPPILTGLGFVAVFVGLQWLWRRRKAM